MLITHCHIQNTDTQERVLSHPLFAQAPYVACIPEGIIQCKSGKLVMPPGAVFRVPVIVWCEAGQRQPWCKRLSDEEAAALLEAAAPKQAEPEPEPEPEPAPAQKKGKSK